MSVEGSPAGRPSARRVVIVDDDPAARYRLRRTLEGLGLEVSEAARAAEGLARVRQERPSAVFLDLVLPDVSGFDILESMHADPLTAAIPVVVMSASRLTGEQEQRLQEPGTAFVPKEAWNSADPSRAVQEALLRAGWGARLVDRERA